MNFFKMNHRCYFFLIAGFVVLFSACKTQKICNYKGDGSVKKSISDFLTVTIEDDTLKSLEGGGAGIGIGDIAGPIAGIALDLINTAISNHQAKFSASTSNSAILNINGNAYNKLMHASSILVVRRYLIQKADVNYSNPGYNDSNIVAEYFFKIDNFDEDAIEFRLKKINLLYSKAKFRAKNELKDYLAVSIDLKLSSGAFMYNIPDSVSKKKDSTSKSAVGDLGESIVKIPIIRTNAQGAPVTVSADNTLINEAYFKGVHAPAKGGTAKITVVATVSEANLSHIKPSLAADFLKNNASDVNTLIKAFFPSGSGSSKSSKN